MRYIIVVNEVDLNGEWFSEASILGGPWRTIKRAEQDMREHFTALLIEDAHLVPGSSYKLFSLDKGHSVMVWEMFMSDLKEEMFPTTSESEWTNTSFERQIQPGFGQNWLEEDPQATDLDYGVGDLD